MHVIEFHKRVSYKKHQEGPNLSGLMSQKSKSRARVTLNMRSSYCSVTYEVFKQSFSHCCVLEPDDVCIYASDGRWERATTDDVNDGKFVIYFRIWRWIVKVWT